MTRLLRSLALLFALFTLAGCPPTDDDDSTGSSDSGELCSGPYCSNDGDCPSVEPDPGDPCTLVGNCHYCDDVDNTSAARGYTCDGSSFSFVDTFDCATPN